VTADVLVPAEAEAVTAPVRSPSLLGDAGGMIATPVRLLWRHWPVLFALGTAGLVTRTLLIQAAIRLAGVNAILGFLCFLLGPLAVMIALVLMFRSMRSSLSIGGRQPTSVIAHVGSVFIPFVTFYFAIGYLLRDYRVYDAGLLARYQGLGAILAGQENNAVRIERSGQTVLLIVVVVFAFALRWGFSRWKVTRRHPALGLPGAYFETVWLTLGLIYVVNPQVDTVAGWVEQRTAWHALVNWWEGAHGPGHSYRILDTWFLQAFPAGYVTRIFVVPLTGLAAACVVYGVTVQARRRPARHSTGEVAWAGDNAEVAADRWLAPLILGVRAIRRAGVAPLMVFCLAAAALQTVIQLLRVFESRVIGPYQPDSLTAAIQPSINGVNDVLTFALLVCLLAAAADRIGRRLEPTPTPTPATVPAGSGAMTASGVVAATGGPGSPAGFGGPGGVGGPAAPPWAYPAPGAPAPNPQWTPVAGPPAGYPGQPYPQPYPPQPYPGQPYPPQPYPAQPYPAQPYPPQPYPPQPFPPQQFPPQWQPPAAPQQSAPQWQPAPVPQPAAPQWQPPPAPEAPVGPQWTDPVAVEPEPEPPRPRLAPWTLPPEPR
jgi:hypothetical protein